MAKKNALAHTTCALLVTLLPLAGCGDDSTGSGGFGTQDAPTYAVISMAFSDSGQATYVTLLPELAPRAAITLESSREFAGYAPAGTIGGYLYVGSGEGPTLERFEVSDDGQWSPATALGFSAYTSMSLTATRFVGATKAYTPFDVANFAIWDPETMTITGELGQPAIATMRGDTRATLGYAYERSGRYIYQPYYYATMDFRDYDDGSVISIIDTETDTYAGLVDAPCPHLHITTQDDDGNVYLSNGQGSIPTAVLDETAARNCMVKIAAGETELDESFTIDFAELTDGLEGSNLFYIGDGIAFFSAYHADRDPEDADFDAITRSSSYHLWTLDLATMDAEIMQGVDYGGGQFTTYRIDGRTIVAIPSGDYSSTAVYEMTPHGAPVKLFDVQGWAFNFFRVR